MAMGSDFDKMIFTVSSGKQYRIEIIDSIIYMEWGGGFGCMRLGSMYQKLYQEYITEKIEKELLREDI